MILNFFNIFLFISSIACIRWTYFNDNKIMESPILLSLSYGFFSVNVYKGDQIIINRDIEKDNIEFGIYCLVSGLSSKSLMTYKFCKETECREWKETDYDTTFQTQLFKITRTPNYNNTRGLILKVTFISSKLDFSSSFHCEADDSVGKFKITSNDIQIRDTNFWSKYYVTNKNNLKSTQTPEITRQSLPNIFKCLPGGLTINAEKPSWFEQLAVSPVEWSVCPVKNNYESVRAVEKATFSSCVKYTITRDSGEIDELIRPRSLSQMTQWDKFVDTNGDLQIYQIKSDDQQPGFSYALMCYRRLDAAEPINTYLLETGNGDDIKTGVQFTGTPATFTKKLEPYSPQIQNVSLYLRKIVKDETPKPVALIAMARASSDAKFTWKFNGNPIYQSNNLRTNDYSVQFVGDITSKDAGIYTLEITDGPNKLVMTIYAVVLGPPSLEYSDCLPLVAYVLEKESQSFSCTFINLPDSLVLKINSIEIPLTQSLDTSRINIGKSYPFLGELHFGVSPVGYSPSERITMTYNVSKLTITQGQISYQDHNVMFLAKNKYGSIARSSSIYVVPNLKENIQSSPEAYNCTDFCNSDVEHKFQCKIKIENYYYRELTIEYYWTINNNRLGDTNGPKHMFTNYFTVDQNKSELTLLKVKSNDTQLDQLVKDALKDNNIECHFNLYSPPEVIPRFMYLSSSDKSLGTMMKARIRLDYVPINTANIYWIIAVILGFIILLLIIILVTRHCMRNKGETYQLDKIERQHGYDPEKEVQEEMFKPYEREDHEPDVMSGGTGDRKLSITGHSVGSADDGELDTYDLDPSNFNEDGSIIGKYGANPRSRAAMT